MARTQTYLLLLQHHKVEVSDALLAVLLHPFPKRLLCDDLADIFVDQAPTEESAYTIKDDSRGDIVHGTQAKALELSLHDIHRRVLPLGESEKVSSGIETIHRLTSDFDTVFSPDIRLPNTQYIKPY